MPDFEFLNQQKDLATLGSQEIFSPEKNISDDDRRKRDEERERELLIKSELITKGEEFGNHFEFLNPRLKYSELDLPKGINKDLFEPGYKKETLERINILFQDIEKFISAPIILDKFGDDHVSRREWEDKYLKEFSSEAQNYYNSNRLGLNHANKIIPFWGGIKELIEDSELKMKEEYFNKLDGFISQIPKSIYNLEPLPYASLSLSDKVKDIEDLSLVILAFIRTLGGPRKE